MEPLKFRSPSELQFKLRQLQEEKRAAEHILDRYSLARGILQARLSALIDIIQYQLADIEARLSALPAKTSTYLQARKMFKQEATINMRRRAHLAELQKYFNSLKRELDTRLSNEKLQSTIRQTDAITKIARKLRKEERKK